MTFAVEKALKSRVVLLVGEEEALRRRALQELIERVAPDGDDFDLSVVHGDVASPEDWLAQAGTTPFLAERRTVVVRHVLRCDDLDRFQPQHLPESALIILVADEEGGDEQKLGRLQTKWEKAVTAGGGFVAKFSVDARSLPGQLREAAQRESVTLSVPAAQALAEMVGGSYSRGLDELEKLRLFVGEGGSISEAHVREVVVPSREWNVFRLVEAAVAGEVAVALAQLRILVTSAAKAEEAAFRNILPQLSRQVRLLWQARAVVEANAKPENVPASLAASFPDKPNFGKEPPYRQARLVSLARQLPYDKLRAAMALVSDADAKLKGMLPQYSAMDTLEQTVLGLAQLAARPARSVR